MALLQTSFLLDMKHLPALDAILDELPIAMDVDAGTVDLESRPQQKVTFFLEQQWADSLEQGLRTLKILSDEDTLDFVELNADRDWQAEAMRNFPAQVIDRFWLYHLPEQKSGQPEGLIPIFVPHAMAFGTGEHATTAMCLEYISEFAAAGKTITKGLDMGCGSAILEIAAVKVLDANMEGIDNDKRSVEIALENLAANEVDARATAVFGDTPPATGDFDLVLANILAQPLIDMAQPLAASVAAGGELILSGYLQKQREDVHNTYEAQGMRLLHTKQRDNWLASLWLKEKA